MKWYYENGGFAVRSDPIGILAIENDRVCLMCGNVVPLEFRTVHRAGCVLPKPFNIREYARVLNVKLENIAPAEDALAPSSPSNS